MFMYVYCYIKRATRNCPLEYTLSLVFFVVVVCFFFFFDFPFTGTKKSDPGQKMKGRVLLLFNMLHVQDM